MNRRTAMFFSLFFGGIIPRALFAQTNPRRTASRSGSTTQKPTRSRPPVEDEDSGLDSKEADSETIPNMPPQAGYKWKTWDIRRYTSAQLPHTATHPQNAILEWIFRRTTDAVWHGEKLAVLGANRTQVRAYHDAETIGMVDEVIERFVQAEEDVLSVHVRVVRTDNVRWRYPVYSYLNFKESGPQGHHVWQPDAGHAAHVPSLIHT